MKTGVLVSLFILAFGGSVQAQTAPPADIQADREAVLARADRLRARAAAVQAEIRQISRDPAIPEEIRAARIESLAEGLEAEGEAIREDVDRLNRNRNSSGPKPSTDQRGA